MLTAQNPYEAKMTPPGFEAIDHIHVFVRNRQVALAWYERVLGLREVSRSRELEGPVNVADANNVLQLAVFEATTSPANRMTIAVRCGWQNFEAWHEHLASVLSDNFRLVDHGPSWSLYFSDPDGNPFEVTSYDVKQLHRRTHSLRST